MKIEEQSIGNAVVAGENLEKPKKKSHQKKKSNETKPKPIVGMSNASAVFAERTQRVVDCGKWLILSPFELKNLISTFTNGEFDQCGKTLIAIFENDAQIKTCFEKRASMLCASRWEIVSSDKNDNESMAQMEVLRDFYGSLSVSSSEAIDAKGGFSDLLNSICRAIIYGYDASAITFYPSRTPSGRATYHGKITTNPISFFEARARKLKIRTTRDAIGKELSGDWILAYYDKPLAPALLTLHFFKAVAEVDWSSVCEKFGTPFVVVQTSAQYGSEEWQQAQDLAGMIGANYNAVAGTDLKLQVEKMAQGEAPHRELVDYFDRAIARLLLGGDLDTMSSNRASGSDAQRSREDYLRQKDRSWAENIIDNFITKPLLKKVFPNSKPKCYLSLSAQNERSLNQIEQIIRIATFAQVPISKDWLYESLGIPSPSGESDSITPVSNRQVSASSKKGEEYMSDDSFVQYANSENSFKKSMRNLVNAHKKDFSPILEIVDEIRNSKDDNDAYLKATKLFQNFDKLGSKVLANKNFAEKLAEEVANHSEDPIDKIKNKLEK